jgi:hypothetical protein
VSPGRRPLIASSSACHLRIGDRLPSGVRSRYGTACASITNPRRATEDFCAAEQST